MAKKKPTERRYSRKPVKARAKELVERAKSGTRKKPVLSWFDKLPREEQHYVEAVVAAMIDEPETSVNSVAVLLKEELGIPQSLSAIKRLIGIMIQNG